MRFIAGGLNGKYLAQLAKAAHIDGATKRVYAAIAYANGEPELFAMCKKHKIPLEFWGRYDGTVSVSLPILQDFLKQKSSNYQCYLVPDILHAKVIWWKGFGAYIGSANLTDRAWFSNIEAGMFFEEKFIAGEFEAELENFFYELRKHHRPLNQEIYNEQEQLEKSRRMARSSLENVENRFEENRRISRNPGLLRDYEKNVSRGSYDQFLKDWDHALQTLRNIVHHASTKYKPVWVPEGIHPSYQTDRFLHSWYRTHAQDGRRGIYMEKYEENKHDPDSALLSALQWWRDMEEPYPKSLERMKGAASAENYASPDKILALTEDEFVAFCEQVWAIRNYAKQADWKSYGLDGPLPKMDVHQRLDYHARWLYNHRPAHGRSVLQILHYVLYGGPYDDVPKRIWETKHNDDYKLAGLGMNTLGEIAGLALPDHFPLRNGLTLKALLALGNAVSSIDEDDDDIADEE